MAKSARQLVDELATCVTCGKVHKERPLRIGSGGVTYAAPDGHTYRTKLLQLTGRSSADFLEMLRGMC